MKAKRARARRWIMVVAVASLGGCNGDADGGDAKGGVASAALAGAEEVAGEVGEVGGVADTMALALGGYHSCALTSAGGVRCWGDNYYGQLGDGTTASSHVPVVVQTAPGVPLAGVRAVSLGSDFSCALLDDGRVRCWGGNVFGQNGHGPQPSSPYAIEVLTGPGAPLAGAQAISMGRHHGCALLDVGQLRCWGRNDVGQLGNGANQTSSYAVTVATAPVQPLSSVRQIALGGLHSCALLEGGGVRCWGINLNAQLGNASGGNANRPDVVLASAGVPLAGAQSLWLGAFHSCARLDDGRTRCWGSNQQGQLGNGLLGGNERYPVTVMASPGVPLADVEELSVRNDHSCARLDGGRVLCWGLNERGQLADGSTQRHPWPTPAERAPGVPLVGVRTVAVGDNHGCAQTSTGRLVCWGYNGDGQLGIPPSPRGGYPAAPLAAPGVEPERVQATAFGLQHGCALTVAGEVLCWGRNHRGQLGDGTNQDRFYPSYVERAPGVRLTGVTSLALGSDQSCAITAEGKALCWGTLFGAFPPFESANPVYASTLLAAPGVPLTGVRSLALGMNAACVALANGQARCWGTNANGQLGNGSSGTFEAYPAAVLTAPGVPLEGVRSLSAGINYACALLETGQVRCWGLNEYGQLGSGTNVNTPYAVTTLTAPGVPLAKAETITAGFSHACARLEGGQARCWGTNGGGQVGVGSFDNAQPYAVTVLAEAGVPLEGVQTISAGFASSCATLANGQARCWGQNTFAELGTGSNGPSIAYPVAVMASPGVPLTGLTTIAAGWSPSTAAVTQSGALFTWGSNDYGELGNGNSAYRTRPVAAAAPLPLLASPARRDRAAVEGATSGGGARSVLRPRARLGGPLGADAATARRAAGPLSDADALSE